MYNATMKLVRATIAAVWKKNKYYVVRKFLFVALGTQREIHMRHIVICGLSGSKIFFYIIL